MVERYQLAVGDGSSEAVQQALCMYVLMCSALNCLATKICYVNKPNLHYMDKKIDHLYYRLFKVFLFVSHISSYSGRLSKQLQLHQTHSRCLSSQPLSNTPGTCRHHHCSNQHTNKRHTQHPLPHLTLFFPLISTQPLF